MAVSSGSGRTQMTIAQLRQIPHELRSRSLPAATESGTVDVGKPRERPCVIEYKLFGQGPVRIVYICGHGGVFEEWHRYVRRFGGEQNQDKYSSLLVNNRGIGLSSAPLALYTITDLAQDMLEVLDHVGWTENKSVHVIGESMGGMIAQRLAGLDGDRVASLTLMSTTSNWYAGFEITGTLKAAIPHIIPQSADASLNGVKQSLFGQDWMFTPDEEADPNKAALFPTNGDRWAATSYLDVPVPLRGAILQAPACIRFSMSSVQLKHIGDKIGRHRIQVCHGSADRMIPLKAAERLRSELDLEESNFHVFSGDAHLVIISRFKEVAALLEQIIHPE